MTIRELFDIIGKPIHPDGVVFLHEYDGDPYWIQIEQVSFGEERHGSPLGTVSKRFEGNEWVYCQFMDGFRERPINDWSMMDVTGVRADLLPGLPERYRPDRIEKFLDGPWIHGELEIAPLWIRTTHIRIGKESVVSSSNEDEVLIHKDTFPLILQAPNLYWELKRLDPTNPVLAKARGEE